MCGAVIKSAGSHYSCLEKDFIDFTSQPIDNSTCKTCHSSINLDLGQITNVGFDEENQYTDEDILITVAISIYVSNRRAFVGETYDLNIAVTLDEATEEIYATILNLTVVDATPALGTVGCKTHPTLPPYIS